MAGKKGTPKPKDSTVRMDTELLYRAKTQAARERRGLKALVAEAVEAYLKRKGA